MAQPSQTDFVDMLTQDFTVKLDKRIPIGLDVKGIVQAVTRKLSPGLFSAIFATNIQELRSNGEVFFTLSSHADNRETGQRFLTIADAIESALAAELEDNTSLGMQLLSEENMSENQYDIALSFAGEDRAYVEDVARILKSANVSVFYDRNEDLWGKDLYVHLDEVYRKKAKYCVMFISQHYARKLWTNHERQSAQARAFRENREYILPARFDDTEIPGIRETVGFEDLRHNNPAQLAEKIIKKLGLSMASYTRTEERKPSFDLPEYAAPLNFNPYKATDDIIGYLTRELQSRFAATESCGYSFAYFERQGRHCFRVKRGSRFVYFVDFWAGGTAGDSGISFYDGWNEPFLLGNESTAMGRVHWNPPTQDVAIDLTNLSLLENRGSSGIITKEQLIEGIWQKFLSVTKQIK